VPSILRYVSAAFKREQTMTNVMPDFPETRLGKKHQDGGSLASPSEPKQGENWRRYHWQHILVERFNTCNYVLQQGNNHPPVSWRVLTAWEIEFAVNFESFISRKATSSVPVNLFSSEQSNVLKNGEDSNRFSSFQKPAPLCWRRLVDTKWTMLYKVVLASCSTSSARK